MYELFNQPIKLHKKTVFGDGINISNNGWWLDHLSL